jgi:hypothetical protein
MRLKLEAEKISATSIISNRNGEVVVFPIVYTPLGEKFLDRLAYLDTTKKTDYINRIVQFIRWALPYVEEIVIGDYKGEFAIYLLSSNRKQMQRIEKEMRLMAKELLEELPINYHIFGAVKETN